MDGGRPYIAYETMFASFLDNQRNHFKVTMKANVDVACAPYFHVNIVIKLYRSLSQSQYLSDLIVEYFKVAKIGYYLVLVSIENVRCFTTLKFLKSY